MKDWLDESDKANADEEKSTTPKNSQAETTDDDDDKDEETPTATATDTEPTLKESIHNINAFVEAHKRLFG